MINVTMITQLNRLHNNTRFKITSILYHDHHASLFRSMIWESLYPGFIKLIPKLCASSCDNKELHFISLNLNWSLQFLMSICSLHNMI